MNHPKLTQEEMEQRRKYWADAIAIGSLGGGPSPSPKYMEMVEKNIRGEITTEEMRAIILEEIRQHGDNYGKTTS